jgi:Fe2+ or Zn2+ uptake regulation protein
MDKGYIKKYRKIIESEIWTKKAWWLKVWEYILIRVNHKSTRIAERGTNFFRTDEIYDNCKLQSEGVQRKTVLNVLQWLKEKKQITIQKTTRGMIITVVNYDLYQNVDFGKTTQETTQKTGVKTTQKRHRNDTIIKECKNDKNTHTCEERSDLKTPVKEMIRIFRAVFREKYAGSPDINYARDGAICKSLYPLCVEADKNNPLGVWEERVRVLVLRLDKLDERLTCVQTIKGIKSFWNKAIPTKKAKTNSEFWKSHELRPRGWKPKETT